MTKEVSNENKLYMHLTNFLFSGYINSISSDNIFKISF